MKVSIAHQKTEPSNTIYRNVYLRGENDIITGFGYDSKDEAINSIERDSFGISTYLFTLEFKGDQHTFL